MVGFTRIPEDECEAIYEAYHDGDVGGAYTVLDAYDLLYDIQSMFHGDERWFIDWGRLSDIVSQNATMFEADGSYTVFVVKASELFDAIAECDISGEVEAVDAVLAGAEDDDDYIRVTERSIIDKLHYPDLDDMFQVLKLTGYDVDVSTSLGKHLLVKTLDTWNQLREPYTVFKSDGGAKRSTGFVANRELFECLIPAGIRRVSQEH